MQSQVHVAVVDVVASVATGARPRERDAHAFPPHRVTRELDRPRETSHVSNRWAEWLGDHLQGRDIDQPGLVRGVFKPDEREQPVDVMKARFVLIALGHLNDLEPAFGSERAPYRGAPLRERELGIRLPRRAHRDISVEDGDIAEADPGSPAGFFDTGAGNRITGENAVVVPLSARLLVDHDDRPHQTHFAEVDFLAAQSAETVSRPDLVGFDEGSASAIGNDDIVQRESVEEIPGDAADVDDPVTVLLEDADDVAANALAAEVAIGEQEGDADQQHRQHHHHRDEAYPPPTH